MESPEEIEETALMARHGIRKQLVPQYLYREFRYRRLSDAMAMAERDEARDPGRR